MPYKQVRQQLNLKLTEAEYTALAEEATLAQQTVAQYARHLIVHRAAQPLNVAAQRLQQQHTVREDALQADIRRLQQQVFELRLQNADISLLEQQLQEARQENTQLRDPEKLQALIHEAIQQQQGG